MTIDYFGNSNSRNTSLCVTFAHSTTLVTIMTHRRTDKQTGRGTYRAMQCIAPHKGSSYPGYYVVTNFVDRASSITSPVSHPAPTKSR